MWRNDFDAKCTILQRDLEGRFLLVEVSPRDSSPFLVACVYAPNDDSERRVFFDNLPWNLLESNSILCGDFNCSTEPGDKVGGREWRLTPSASALKSAITRTGLIDPVMALLKP